MSTITITHPRALVHQHRPFIATVPPGRHSQEEDPRISYERHSWSRWSGEVLQTESGSPRIVDMRSPKTVTAGKPPARYYATARDTTLTADAVERMSRMVVRSAVEVLRGERSPQQLVRWLAPPIQDALNRRARVAERATRLGGNPRGRGATMRPVAVLNSTVSMVTAQAAEVSVTVRDHDRVRAAAVRIEVSPRGMQQVVALEIG